jgi:PAS domain S-box-containing protein
LNLSDFNRILRQVSLLPVLVLLLMAGAFYKEFRDTNNTVTLIQRSDERIAQAALVGRLMVDEETGLRGYQATNDPQFLEPYHKADPLLQQQFDAMEAVSRANGAAQLENIQKLREDQRTWHDQFAEHLIAVEDAGGNTSSVALNLQGKKMMDELRSVNNTILRSAAARKRERIDLWHKQMRNLLWTLIAVALSAGLAIAAFTRNRMHLVSAAYRSSLDELNQRAQEIFQSEQELRTTLASIGDGVISCDSEGRVLLMNPVAQELTGWTQNEASGKPLEEVFQIIQEKTRKTVENPVTKVKRMNRVVGLANHTLLIRKDGVELHIADSGAPIRDEAGQILGVVLVFRDVSIERRTEEALLANEKLVVAGRLAATIAHEIHNPLDSVSNLLYLMRTGSSPEESAQFMAIAEQELARVTHISRAMLGLYRESQAPVPVDLKDTLEQTLLLMERRFLDLGVTATSEFPDALTIEGYPAELRQVFTNLITNAGEAAGSGGHVRVSLKPQATGALLGGQKTEAGALIEIADDGPGIPPEIQAHLFQPFFTTKGQAGTGLGLWVSQGIVNKHGGRLMLKSDHGTASHGTVVTIFLAQKMNLDLHAD